MNGKEGGHAGAPPEGSRHKAKYGKEQDRVDEMKDDICPMVTAGIGPKQLPVQHMRKPGQGVPVGTLLFSEGPDKPFHRPLRLNMGIISNIEGIIVIDEAIIANRLVADQDHQTQD